MAFTHRSALAPLFLFIAACAPHSNSHPQNPAPPPQEQSPPPPPPPTAAPTSPAPQPKQPDKQDQRRQLLEALKQTEFGSMVSEYLYGNYPETAIREQSNRIMDRMFENGGRFITYLSALHLLAEDAFETGRLGPEQSKRLLMLESGSWQKQADVASYPGEGLAYYAAAGLLVTLPFGSPLFRHYMKYWVNRGTAPLAEWTGIERFHAFKDAAQPSQPFFSRQLGRDFSISYGLGTYFKYLGPFTMLYFYWFDWSESAKGHSLNTQLEKKLTQADLNRLMKEIRDL